MEFEKAPEWQSAKYGMFLYLPYNENNKEFLSEMKDTVPSSERRWDANRTQWWISDAWIDEVDELLFKHFERQGYGRDV